ncbi:MAG TPA: hypothetical protein VM510_07605, partial [Caulifigura sp.]|nr:hypothetical protein [Caulifigura sp.]
SALQRWKEARSEWIGSSNSTRRERRQQIRHSGQLDATFAPDDAAPSAVLPVPTPGVVELDDLSAEAEPPKFIAPPRSPQREAPPASVPMPIEPAPALTSTSAGDNPPKKDLFDSSSGSPRPFPAPRTEPQEQAVATTANPFEIAPAEPSAVKAPTFTAYLPQIPRPPVSSSPTPANPPSRLPPAPAPRLPDESRRFIVPRSDLILPPEPERGQEPRIAAPTKPPELRRITDIQPFKSCSTDGSGVKMCPPNTAGEGSDRCPEQQPLPVFEGAERNFIDLEYCWDASNIFHTPLYFEDIELERYGHTYCEPLQTVASAAKFGVQFVGLPYQMALAPVHKREYPLGYYRPGDPAPYKCYQIPWNTEAALKAAYVYTGMSFITP